MPAKTGRAHEKIAITLPSDLASAVRAEAKARKPRSLSAFIAEVLREKLEQDGLQKVLDDIFAENPMTEEERASSLRSGAMTPAKRELPRCRRIVRPTADPIDASVIL